MSTLIAEEPKVEVPEAKAEPFLLPSFKAPLSPNLFTDCLLEKSGPERRRRSGSLLFSLTVQCLILVILILIPLIYTDVLPLGQLLSATMIAPPPPPPPPPPAVIRPASISSDLFHGQLVSPTAIPTKIKMIREEEAPPSDSGVVGGVVGGVPGGQMGGVMNGVLGGIVGSTHPVAQTVALAKPMRISQGVSEGMLLTRVEPDYPRIAKISRIEGTVILEAIISREGAIENLHVVSGHPALIDSALNAVKQWRYKPYLLSGTPVEVQTTVTVRFYLNRQ